MHGFAASAVYLQAIDDGGHARRSGCSSGAWATLRGRFHGLSRLSWIAKYRILRWAGVAPGGHLSQDTPHKASSSDYSSRIEIRLRA